MPGGMWRDMADRFSRHGGLSQTTFLERQFEGVYEAALQTHTIGCRPELVGFAIFKGSSKNGVPLNATKMVEWVS